MNRNLVDRLPSFLAYPLARYQCSALRSPQVLFQILESLLLYVECLLRAQTKDHSDLGRPGSLGLRTERILLLSRRLNEARVPLLVEFIEQGRRDEDLSRLVAFRNRWVHAKSPAPDADAADPDWSQAAIERLLWKVTPVTIDVFRTGPSADSHTFSLHGLRGLFEAPVSHHEGLLVGLEDGSLVAQAPGQEPVILAPFFILTTGKLGENRVKMLARVVGAKKEYFDPVDLFELAF
jgi:hypothetical protein